MESAHLAPRRLIRSAKQTLSSFPRLLKLFGRLGIKTTWFIPEAVWGKFAQDLYGAFSVKRLLLGFSASSLNCENNSAASLARGSRNRMRASRIKPIHI
jgi:hypothetical protein